MTNVSPSSLVSRILSSNATGDAKKVAGTGTRPPSYLRSPVSASMQVMMPPSVIRYSSRRPQSATARRRRPCCSATAPFLRVLQIAVAARLHRHHDLGLAAGGQEHQPLVATGLGIGWLCVPLARHSSLPVAGSYEMTTSAPDAISSSRVPVLTTSGVAQLRRVVRLRAPDLLARLPLERDDVRARAHFLVALQNQQILIDDRRRAGPEARLDDAAEVRLPGQVALEVVGIDARRLERGIHPFPVGHHRRRRERVLAVAIVEHHAVVRRPFPGELAGDASTANTLSACLNSMSTASGWM